MEQGRSERYRVEARHAREQAGAASDEEARRALLQIAEQYDRLAEWAERVERSGMS